MKQKRWIPLFAFLRIRHIIWFLESYPYWPDHLAKQIDRHRYNSATQGTSPVIRTERSKKRSWSSVVRKSNLILNRTGISILNTKATTFFIVVRSKNRHNRLTKLENLLWVCKIMPVLWSPEKESWGDGLTCSISVAYNGRTLTSTPDKIHTNKLSCNAWPSLHNFTS